MSVVDSVVGLAKSVVGKVSGWLGGLNSNARVGVSLGSSVVVGMVVTAVADGLTHNDVIPTVVGLCAAWATGYGVCRLGGWACGAPKSS